MTFSNKNQLFFNDDWELLKKKQDFINGANGEVLRYLQNQEFPLGLIFCLKDLHWRWW